MFTQPVTIYTFQCLANWKRQAITIEKKGANLPKDLCTGGRWRFLKSYRISESDGPMQGVDINELRAALASQGWFVWDIAHEARMTGTSGRAR